MRTIIESLYEYFKACPLMGTRKLNIDFLPEQGVEYSIDTTPATEIVKQYADGGSIRQYLFVIRSVNDYGADVLQNISNSGFFERFAAWLENQNKSGVLPILPEGKMAQTIQAQSTAYLHSSCPGMGRYQIQCRLTYYQEVKTWMES